MRVATIALWVLAISVAIGASRYFFLSQERLRYLGSFSDTPAARAGAMLGANALRDYPLLFPAHVGGGIVALIAGLFQFRPGLRAEKPRLHRRIGMTYIAAVTVGAATGLPLSLLILRIVPRLVREEFLPMSLSFFALSVAWAITSAIAYQHARSRRYSKHRAWMMRSYSLTFAAVTVRLVAGILTFATGDVVFAVNSGVLSWPLNLIVTEWLIQRRSEGAGAAMVLERE